MDNDTVAELLPFLEDKRAEVRKMTVDGVLSCTSTEEGKNTLMAFNGVLKKLMKLFDDEQEIAYGALRAVCNLCSVDGVTRELEKEDIVKRLFDTALDADSVLQPIGAMVLANVTQRGEVVTRLLKRKTGFLELVMRFLRPIPEGGEDPLEYFGLALSNITRINEGRNVIGDSDRGLIPLLAQSLNKNTSAIRRGGVIGALRNMLFNVKFHPRFLVDAVLVKLVTPIVGPKLLDEEDRDGLPQELKDVNVEGKTRDPDPEVRKMIVEILQLLLKTREGREFMRSRQVYPVLRDMNIDEEDADVCAAMVEVVSGLMLMDETPVKPDDPPEEHPEQIAGLEEDEEAAAAEAEIATLD